MNWFFPFHYIDVDFDIEMMGVRTHHSLLVRVVLV